LSEEPSAVASSAAPWTVPWGLPTAAVTLLVSFSFEVLGAVVLFAVVGKAATSGNIEYEILGYQFLVLGVVVGLLTLIFARYNVKLSDLGFQFPGWEKLGTTVLIALVSIVAGIAILSFLFTTFLPQYHLQGNARELLGQPRHISIAREVIILVWAAVEAPLAEETLFRGIIFQGLRQFFLHRFPYGWSVFGGALISGIVFGLVHGEIHTLPILALLGVILAYVFQVSRSVYASALVHGIVNGIAVAQLFGRP
jgi:membrane protease YdiL (CAAX protease family)